MADKTTLDTEDEDPEFYAAIWHEVDDDLIHSNWCVPIEAKARFAQRLRDLADEIEAMGTLQ